MTSSKFLFFGFLLLLTSCVDGRQTPKAAATNLSYEAYRGTMEMDANFNLFLGDWNNNEFKSDIEIHVEIEEERITFTSVEFEFDVAESKVYEANQCQAFGAHCTGFQPSNNCSLSQQQVSGNV